MLKNAFWLFIIALFILIVFLPSYTKMQDLKYKNAQYQAQIQELKQERVHLLEEKRRLETDPEYLEKVAREKMGIIRKGETVYRLDDE